jgi:hypothetical protein
MKSFSVRIGKRKLIMPRSDSVTPIVLGKTVLFITMAYL